MPKAILARTHMQGDTAGSIEVYAKTITLHPSYALAYYNLVWAHVSVHARHVPALIMHVSALAMHLCVLATHIHVLAIHGSVLHLPVLCSCSSCVCRCLPWLHYLAHTSTTVCIMC